MFFFTNKADIQFTPGIEKLFIYQVVISLVGVSILMFIPILVL